MSEVYGKEWDLLNVMNVRKLDVLCVSATKRKGKEVQDMQGGCLALWYGVESGEHGSQGTGMIFSEKANRHLRKYELVVSPRILWVRMKIGILSVCSNMLCASRWYG
jgi:hypothetical protein